MSYTGINLVGMFEIFFKLNNFTFVVILMFHLACVQTTAWMDFDYVCYTGINLEGTFEIFYKLNNFTFVVILMFHLACVQTLHGWILIMSAILASI